MFKEYLDLVWISNSNLDHVKLMYLNGFIIDDSEIEVENDLVIV